MANKGMAAVFEASKNITLCESKVSVKISMTDENVAQLEKLAEEILA